MDPASLKLHLIQQINATDDPAVLDKIRGAIRRSDDQKIGMPFGRLRTGPWGGALA